MLTKVEPHSFLRSRRSIRRFSGKVVEPELISRIVETATFAPSAHNSQPWRFVILTSLKSKQNLAEKMAAVFKADLIRDGISAEVINIRLDRSRERIVHAPVVVILCLDETALDHYDDSQRQDAEIIMGVQSTAMAGLQFLLAAHAEGLGGVWTCGPLFAPEVIHSALSIPNSWRPQGMLLVGYSNEQPKNKELKVLEEVELFIE